MDKQVHAVGMQCALTPIPCPLHADVHRPLIVGDAADKQVHALGMHCLCTHPTPHPTHFCNTAMANGCSGAPAVHDFGPELANSWLMVHVNTWCM